MIWFDALIEFPASEAALRRVVSKLVDCGYDDVEIIFDIADLADRPATCLVQNFPPGEFSQQISIYLGMEFSFIMDRCSIFSAATSCATSLESRIMIADDRSASPYSMVCIDPNGIQQAVQIDATALDEFGIYRIT